MTVSLVAAGSHVAPRRTPADTAAPAYGRRRVVAVALLVGLLAVGGSAAHDVLAGSGGVPASAAGATPAPDRNAVVARVGDTLWSIAERFHGEIAFGPYLEALINLNGGPSIQAGQAITLP